MVDNPIISGSSRNADTAAFSDKPTITLKSRGQASSRNPESALPSSGSPADRTLKNALNGAADSIKSASQTAETSGASGSDSMAKASSLSERDVEVMNYARMHDGQYLLREGQFERRGNTFYVTEGLMEGYKIIYKGGRNFQIRNPDNEPLMIYHGPRRRPRIAPSENEQVSMDRNNAQQNATQTQQQKNNAVSIELQN